MKKRRQRSPEQRYKGIVFCDEMEIIFYNHDFKDKPRLRTLSEYVWKYRLKEYKGHINKLFNKNIEEKKHKHDKKQRINS